MKSAGSSKVKSDSHWPAIIVVVILFIAASVAVVSINQSHQQTSPETWTAFIYKNGYQSAKYQMEDGFDDYQMCKDYAVQQSEKFDNAPWQCGLRCRFDSMRQGYQCDSMENH
ncbi:hypothetical protein ACRWQN_05385 [Shewanella sp. HL-SH8]|uniref:hypothetical protein n=1 Tax=unclassified Shewanella TaxID=196818 RepID=UPI003EBEF6CE